MTNEAADARRSAVALSYADKNKAPVVVAKGYGIAAESIMRQARDSGLYVHSSPELIKLLMQVDLDQQVPPQLYLAVAEVMAWVWRLENDASGADAREIAPRGNTF